MPISTILNAAVALTAVAIVTIEPLEAVKRGGGVTRIPAPKIERTLEENRSGSTSPASVAWSSPAAWAAA